MLGKASEIKLIMVKTIDYNHFTTRTAVVETECGKCWQYSLDYSNQTWKNEEDYLDNAKTDFENEAECGIEDTELFFIYKEDNRNA